MKKIYAVIAILLVIALAGCAIVSPIENPPSKEETSSVNETSSEEISSIEETSSVEETPTFEVPESTYVVTQKTAEEKSEIKRARILILGDSFTAGFLSAKLRGMETADCLRFSAACAAQTVQQVGARSALPTRAQVEDFLANQ